MVLKKMATFAFLFFTLFTQCGWAQSSCRHLLMSKTEIVQDKMDRILNAHISRGDFTKIRFQVTDRNGKAIFQFQNANFSRTTPMPVLSASKWVSTTAIMKLVELKILNLDDTVGTYIASRDQVQLPEAIGSITLRQLLSFTSGLTGKSTSFLRTDLSLEASVHNLFEESGLYKPEISFDYNDNHLQVASLMAILAVKKITGVEKTFQQIVDDYLTRPLGISDIGFFSKPRKKEGAQNPRAAAGLVISFNDYQKFLQMLMNGGTFQGQRILKTETLMEMEKAQADISQDKNIFYSFGNWRTNDENSSPGYAGWYPVLNRERGYTAMLGALEVGDASTRSAALYDELRPLIYELIAVLSN